MLCNIFYKGSSKTEQVKLVAPASGYDYANDQFSRFEDTDLWFACFKLRSDLVSTYWIAENSPLVQDKDIKDTADDEANWKEQQKYIQIDPLNK